MRKAGFFVLTKGRAFIVAGIGLTYEVTCGIIKNWNQSPHAKVIGVSTDVAEFGIEESVSIGSERLSDHGKKELNLAKKTNTIL